MLAISSGLLVSELDIALFKLMSAANRATEKDIYDLDFLTEKFSLHDLVEQLKEKQQSYSNASDRNIFDLDKEVSPLDEPLRLLKFDDLDTKRTSARPHHSQNRVDILKGQKSWSHARSGWRKKVRTLFDKLSIEFPGPASFDVE